jgi:hypothetical protein
MKYPQSFFRLSYMDTNTGQMLYDLMVLEKSSEWLDQQVNAVIDQINTEELKTPQDEDRLDALHTQLKILYKRCEIEAKIGDQLNKKYGYTDLAAPTGKAIA